MFSGVYTELNKCSNMNVVSEFDISHLQWMLGRIKVLLYEQPRPYTVCCVSMHNMLIRPGAFNNVRLNDWFSKKIVYYK